MAETKSTKKWYVVRSVSGQENKIKSYIESEITRLNLQDYIEQYFGSYRKGDTDT